MTLIFLCQLLYVLYKQHSYLYDYLDAKGIVTSSYYRTSSVCRLSFLLQCNRISDFYTLAIFWKIYAKPIYLLSFILERLSLIVLVQASNKKNTRRQSLVDKCYFDLRISTKGQLLVEPLSEHARHQLTELLTLSGRTEILRL